MNQGEYTRGKLKWRNPHKYVEIKALPARKSKTAEIRLATKPPFDLNPESAILEAPVKIDWSWFDFPLECAAISFSLSSQWMNVQFLLLTVLLISLLHSHLLKLNLRPPEKSIIFKLVKSK